MWPCNSKSDDKATCPANVTIKIDHTSPTCTNVVTCTAGEKCNDWLGIGKYVKITAKCTDEGGSNCAASEEISYTYRDKNIKITRIAHGLPVGSDLSYADEMTILKAFEGRREY